MGAKIIEVIYTDNTRHGDGKIEPVRIVEEYYKKDGTLLFQKDPLDYYIDPDELLSFIKANCSDNELVETIEMFINNHKFKI